MASRAVPPPNESEQPVAQTRVPPVIERRLAPHAAEPRDASVAALAPEPSPRRTVAEPPSAIERRFAPDDVEPRDASVAALVPQRPPRRTVAQPTVPRESDTAEPMRSVRPLPVMPVIAIAHQAGDSVLAGPTGALAATPPNAGEIAPAPVPHTGDAAPSRDRDAPAPIPTIHVTIGRVEVRAVQAPARDPRPVRASGQPMSLDEYLRRRGQRGQP
jgi:hypothetical protein